MKKYIINIVLFIITVITTTFAGTLQRGLNPFIIKNLIAGLPFSISIIIILGSHELGHYFVARKNGISATFPYFIPAPHFIGTFGAVIKMQSPIPNRKTLIEVGAAGPITGFIFSTIAIIFGLKLSSLVKTSGMEGIRLGNSILFYILSKISFKEIKEGYDILLHPVAFAGWIGYFVTAMNLFPIGQLDGGHIIYGLFPSKQRLISLISVIIMVGFGFLWNGWLFFSLITMVLIGIIHPPTIDDYSPIDLKSIIIGIIAMILFILTFIPAPFSV
uniref:Site-2 protease family protein n=1 Tax=candidate division WOR-3 bacterium TaxID=2052148 RepID=A0A7C4UD83_UNCW3